ncbi:MAG: outer-membrane lipoprotein carrier protein LolA [Alphaproteobacteria bacterium]
MVFWDSFSQEFLPAHTLKCIEKKLNHIETLKARFIQKDSSDQILSGTFYLVRPFNIRFEYDAPAPCLIVSDEKSLIYEDYKTQQVTFFPAKALLPDLLTKKNISLSKDVKILKSWIKDGNSFLFVANEAGGQIMFEFNKEGTLKGWTTQDAFDQTIKVSLLRTEENIPLASDLFVYKRSPTRKHKHQS